jgi:hypothetical protein
MRLFGVNEFFYFATSATDRFRLPAFSSTHAPICAVQKAVAPLIWPALAQKVRDQCLTRSVPESLP